MRYRNRFGARLIRAVVFACLMLLAGGCTTASVGDPPHLQETVTARCPEDAIKECRVWGGNRFSRRYEYCGCRDIR